MEENTEIRDQDLFLDYINRHYDRLKNKYRKFCETKDYPWDEDVFSDTILKCYDLIVKKGELKDKSPHGMESYFFMAFRNNILNEQRYARNKKRDRNVSSDELNDLYETWYNDNHFDARVKITNDLFKDFSLLYIMTQVEDNFDEEHFYLFKLKTLCGLQYQELYKKTKIKHSMNKVIEVMNWVKENIKKEDVRKLFYNMYGDLL